MAATDGVAASPCTLSCYYETAGDNPKEAERKIKSRLRRKRLGTYDQVRINRLGALKDDLQKEFRALPSLSAYFLGCKSGSADSADYDIPRLAKDLRSRYPDIPLDEVEHMANLAVFLHYVR